MLDGRSRLSGAMVLVRKSSEQFMDIYGKMDSLRVISRLGDDCMLAASLCRSVWVRSEARHNTLIKVLFI